ncbi:type IV pilus modification protein PilV [Endozoicomonas atrinae]|uniref:type IV pilus modification protein PilV n=1 Tax=Endozoicomonas atrinae TaxID=1333660 RepID=UPI003AFFB24A
MSRNNGFTMIEVLVAMIIISVGLLGIAGLVVESRKNIVEVQQRSIALQLAEDLLARINANNSGLASYNGTITAAPAQPGTLCNAANSNCTPAQTAAFDLWQWGSALYGNEVQTAANTNAGGLISPLACININNTDVTLTIVWRGKFTRPDTRPAVTCGDADTDYRSAVDNDLRRVMVIETTIS